MSAKEEDQYATIQRIARELVARTGRCTSVDVRRLLGESSIDSSAVYRGICRCEDLAIDWTAGGCYTVFVKREAVTK